MLKRIIHWNAYRKMNQLAERHDWQGALEIAKQIDDKELRRWFAVCRCVQILNELECEV